MRKLRAVSWGVVWLSAGLTGCFSTTRTVQKTQAPDVFRTASVETLQKDVADRDAAIQTLNASVLITATTGGGKEGKVTEYTSFRGYIFVRKPRDLRVLLQLPVIGSRAMDMVSNGDTFTLLIPPRNRAIVGTNKVTKPSANGLENLRPQVFFDSLLVPPVAPDEFVTLVESTRVVQPETRHHEAIEEPDYDLTVMRKKAGDANVLQQLRVIHINRVNMLPYQQDVYDDKGQIVTQALYDKYQAYGTQQFPSLITIRRPLDEYSLKVEITKLTLNEKLEDDQFELKIPPGVTVQKME
jgi:outer membrane lipoprotein-sorting protein